MTDTPKFAIPEPTEDEVRGWLEASQCAGIHIVWVPVTEELPEHERVVLFWNIGTVDHKPGCYVGWYSNKVYDGRQGRWFDIFGNSIYDGVSHWGAMPKGPDGTQRIGLDIGNNYYESA